MKLSTDQINHLNIGLMILSCAVAFKYPFELFVFSYAVLGPLHYLTEISWLHDRNYFVQPGKRKRDKRRMRAWLILVAVAMLVLLFGFVMEKVLHQTITTKWEIALFYLVFVTALLVTLVKSKGMRMAILLLTLCALFFFNGTRYYTLIAFLIATIIHVLVFTGAFILLGAIRSRSLSGILSLVVFVVCAVSFFVYVPGNSGHNVGEYIRNSYSSRLGSQSSLIEVYESTAGLMVMRLIAFAYTYHYLNWFSKTSIIKWHEIPIRRSVMIVGLWLVALGIFAYNYDTGMIALYVLSILHVMLEFPLNHQTFASIGKELHAMAR